MLSTMRIYLMTSLTVKEVINLILLAAPVSIEVLFSFCPQHGVRCPGGPEILLLTITNLKNKLPENSSSVPVGGSFQLALESWE